MGSEREPLYPQSGPLYLLEPILSGAFTNKATMPFSMALAQARSLMFDVEIVDGKTLPVMRVALLTPIAPTTAQVLSHVPHRALESVQWGDQGTALVTSYSTVFAAHEFPRARKKDEEPEDWERNHTVRGSSDHLLCHFLVPWLQPYCGPGMMRYLAPFPEMDDGAALVICETAEGRSFGYTGLVFEPAQNGSRSVCVRNLLLMPRSGDLLGMVPGRGQVVRIPAPRLRAVAEENPFACSDWEVCRVEGAAVKELLWREGNRVYARVQGDESHGAPHALFEHGGDALRQVGKPFTLPGELFRLTHDAGGDAEAWCLLDGEPVKLTSKEADILYGRYIAPG